MKCILPILAWLVLAGLAPEISAQTAAQTPSGTPAAPADSIAGDVLLRRVMATLDAQHSIAAKVRHKVDLRGRPMFGTGLYLQQGRGAERMLRFELKLQTPLQPTTMVEICDSTSLWILEDSLEAKTTLGRVDLVRLRRARPKSPPATGLPAFNTWFALGGLPKLLASLDTSFRFGPVVDNRLDDVRVWTLDGQWEPGRLAQFLPDQKGAIDAGGAVDLTRLAPNVPDRVTMHIGCDDLFPYRFEYWRADATTKPGERGKLLVVMELYEVQLGVPIDRRQFAFTPDAALPPVDRTQQFLDRLFLEDVPPGEAMPFVPRRR